MELTDALRLGSVAARSDLSRREFLQRSGVLIVGFSAAGLSSPIAVAPDQIEQGGRSASTQLDSWIAVAADGTVTAYTGKCELGQGMQTAQIQLIAEELGVAVNRIRLIQCDTAVTPDQGTTSGSQSHPTNFNERNLALAAATARQALFRLAATRLAAPIDQLAVHDGIVSIADNPAKRVAYADLIGDRKFNLPLDATAKRRPAAAWSVLGTSVKRVDMPDMASGRLEYVHNVRVPGMLHGRVVRPPEVGATVVGVDERSIADIPGIVKVVVRKNFVGVIAEKEWPAIQAAGRLLVTWSAGTGLPDATTFYEYVRRQPSRDSLSVDSGDVDERLTRAATVVKATYLHPYQMHGSIGTSCAVADVTAGRATVWCASQSVFGLRSTSAALLGLKPDDVRVIFRRGSGCYGINGADTVAYDAALLSQAVGRPVRVQLSRKDEMAWENYGFAYVIEQRAGLDREGNIAVWDYEGWSASLGGRPGYDRPGNVVTGSLAGFEPASFAARTPAPPPSGRFNNGSNATPSYVVGCVGGECGGTGTIASERVLSHTIRSPFFTGPLRSPSRLQNTFAHESFMDEIAAKAGADPVAFRLKHLRDPRLKEVVATAARAARWETRPSPRRTALNGNGARNPSAIASGRGISCVLYEGDNGYCALVAEVDVDVNTGRIAVTRFVAAQDCGPISTPDGMKNQIEGGLLQGLSRALGEEVTWDGRKVTSVDWRTFHSLTLGSEVPAIDAILINRPDAPATGAGETAITLVASAVGNAVFDATGVRLRQVPFTPERVKAALMTRA
jgi:nicotinate dehydrogenase subunit B